MITSLNNLQYFDVTGADGRIGYLLDFYFDDQTWMARYALVHMNASGNERDVLLSTASFQASSLLEHSIKTGLSIEKVANSPEVDANQPISRQQEEELSSYYLWPQYWIPTTGFGLGVGDLSATPMVDLEADLQEQAERSGAGNLPDSHLFSAQNLLGFHILTQQNEDIGVVEDFLVDDRRWDIQFIVTDVGSWADIHKVVFSTEWVERFSRAQSILFVDLSKEAIRTSPEYTGELDANDIHRLYEHYEREETRKSPGAGEA